MTIPPYNPQVPQAEDSIADGQEAFLTNFSTMFSAFGTNHIDLNDPTNPGNHNVIQLTEQTASRSTESAEIAIYSKKVADQKEQLFMRYPLNGKEFQLNEYQIYEVNHIPNIQASYFSILPGGIIVYFGYVNPTRDNFPINLDPVICRNIMGVNLCPIGTSISSRVLYQSNVSLIWNEGKVSQVVLKNSTTLSTPPSQYYVIYGNILA